MERNLHPYLQTNEFSLDEIIFPPVKIPDFELKEVDTTTNLTSRIRLRTPLLSAPMDTVTGADMAILLACQGGIGVIHYNFRTIGEQMVEVDKVRRFESGFVKDPIVLGRDATVGIVLEHAEHNGFFSYPITEDGTLDTKMVGIVTRRDVRYREDSDQGISEVMTPMEKVVTARREETLDTNDIRAANAIIRLHNLDTLPIIDKDGKVVALVTDSDLKKNEKYPLATKDDDKRLKVMIAVESRFELARERILEAIRYGVSGIVVDSRNIYADHLKIAQFTKMEAPELDVFIGNVVMPQVIDQAMEVAGEYIDCFRGGMGTGEVCTTSEDLGLGRAAGSATKDNKAAIARWEDKLGRHIGLITDGGVKYPRHILGALILGADAVMMGSVLAGVDESPVIAVWNSEKGMMVKKVRGMGSASAIRERMGSDRYRVDATSFDDRYPEGIEKVIPYTGSGARNIRMIFNGVRQGMHGLGCRTVEQLYREAVIYPVARSSSKGTL